MDARVLAHYAQAIQPPGVLKDPEQAELATLMSRRRQLRDMIVMEGNRRRTGTPKGEATSTNTWRTCANSERPGSGYP